MGLGGGHGWRLERKVRGERENGELMRGDMRTTGPWVWGLERGVRVGVGVRGGRGLGDV